MSSPDRLQRRSWLWLRNPVYRNKVIRGRLSRGILGTEVHLHSSQVRTSQAFNACLVLCHFLALMKSCSFHPVQSNPLPYYLIPFLFFCPVTFSSVPFHFVPLYSVPFRSVSFRSTPFWPGPVHSATVADQSRDHNSNRPGPGMWDGHVEWRGQRLLNWSANESQH